MIWFLLVAACRSPEVAPEPSPSESATHAHSGHGSPVDSVDTATFATPPYEGPAVLSQAGLYADVELTMLIAGAHAIHPRFPLWSDGADKTRWLFLPAGSEIDTSDPDRFVFPVGTRAVKEFRLGGRRVETRLSTKTSDGWDFISFVWREDGSDADAAPDGRADVVDGYDVPSRADCYFCHGSPSDGLLSVDAVQLGQLGVEQLPVSAIVGWDPPGDPEVATALGYLHGNCASCHREGSLAGDRSTLWLDVPTGLDDPARAPAVLTGVDQLAQHRVDGTTVNIVAGDREASQLWVRMGLRDLEAMPPRGTEIVDQAGVGQIGAWIDGLNAR
jgi:hypothetical protein